MYKYLICIFIGIIFPQDDGLSPNFVYLEPIEDFVARNSIPLEIIVTDRNEINKVSLFYRFNDDIDWIQREMSVSSQPVIFEVEIPLDEVEPGFIQYYFYAKDEFGNQATWPEGGEDLPVVLPVYRSSKIKEKEDPLTLIEDVEVFKEFESLKDLEDNLPYYLEMGMIAPEIEVSFEDGVPIILLSVYDPENIVKQETVKLIIDGEIVNSNISEDMITFIPTEPFQEGFHIVRYESKNSSDESLVKEFSFLVKKKEIIEDEVDKVTWRETIGFKGNLGWNADYDHSPESPIDVHKINSSAKFQLGNFKFNFSSLLNTHIFDYEAREEASTRQPSNRLKFKIDSPNFNFHYGDNSPEFSDFSLKGTRVRGIHAKIKYGNWQTAIVTGETKHWISSNTNTGKINIWDENRNYEIGEKVYDNSITWIAQTNNLGSEPCEFSMDTCAFNINWIESEESDFTEINNDNCIEIDPFGYGLNPDTLSLAEAEQPILGENGGLYWIWNGDSCEEIFIYSTVHMITREDGLLNGNLYNSYDECRTTCQIPIIYQKGSPIRKLEGFRTSNDFFEHIKLGISAIRSKDIQNKNLAPFQILDDYKYEGNFALASDFKLHFNNDRTILFGEYGISLTIDQSFSDTLILKKIHEINQNLYSYIDWNEVDYCLDENCIDINGDSLITFPKIINGVSDSLLQEIELSKNSFKEYNDILGFNINDDINGYADGRGLSGLTGPEVSQFINGNMSKKINLLMKRPAYKIIFKTPITLPFTELSFQSELNQAPINYLSHGTSSIQTDVRNFKNKLGFKLLKSQLNFSFAYDNQIKSPWDPEIETEEIKRAMTNTWSSSIGMNFRNYPGLNYSIRLQDRQDLLVSFNDGLITENISGEKKISTHTITPTYKINLGKSSINLNGSMTLVNDIDLFLDEEGCFEVLNSFSSSDWGGISGEIISSGGEVFNCVGNEYYFTKKNNPIRDSGNLTSTYTSAISFVPSKSISMNFGWGLSVNSPSDLRQSETVIKVYSIKIGQKFLSNKISFTIGGNYVVGYKGKNGFWDSGEIFTIDNGTADQFDINDVFIDKVELDNNKIGLKVGAQYKVSEQNINLGLNLDYSKTTDKLSDIQKEPTFKAKISVKYGF